MFIYNCCNSKKCEIAESFPGSQVKSAADLLKLVCVPSRLNILLLLKRSPHCVCEIISHTKLSQTLISHHMADLTKAKLVESKKDGKFTIYNLTDKGKKVVSCLMKLL